MSECHRYQSQVRNNQSRFRLNKLAPSAVLLILSLPCSIVLLLPGCNPSVRFASTPQSEQRTGSGTVYHEGQTFSGTISYYGQEFHGRKTANGETYNMYDKTAAHLYLPFDSIIRVTNTKNGKFVIVRINDRGPFKGTRILDLSYQAAKEIDLLREGTTEARIKILRLGKI